MEESNWYDYILEEITSIVLGPGYDVHFFSFIITFGLEPIKYQIFPLGT